MTPPGALLPNTPFSALREPYERWLNEGETMRPYSKHTIRAYLRAFDSFFSFAQKNELRTPDEVNTAWLRAYVRELGSLGLSSASVSANMAAIETFFAFCQYEGVNGGNPVEAFRLDGKRGRRGGRAPKRIPPVLYHHERDALIDVVFARVHANRDRDLALIGFILDSGLRTEEVCALTLAQARTLLEAGQIRVIGKGNKERLVRPMDRYRDFLKSYVESRRREEGSSWLFPSRTGTAMSQPNMYKIISRYLAEAGISKPQMGGHLLRHTAASLMLASGENIRRVQEFLGHASITTTENYLHLLD